MIPLLEQTPEQLRDWFVREGFPAYRAGQVRKWVFQKLADGFDAMTDLPVELRRTLAERFAVWTTQIVRREVAADGTEKLLLALGDGQRIECVLLRDDKDRHTACISTQVGCAMGCAFCATGLDGVVRNLSSGEILEQLLRLQRIRQEHAEGRTAVLNVVVMGMGEPLLNLDALLPALATACDRNGLGLSERRITISTVGLPDGIRRLAAERCQYHLAVSLHAPDDELRNRLVPANRKFGVAGVLAAADAYFERTGRRVTFEYVLLAGVNDQPDHARRLVGLLRGRPSLVNLILYNPVPGLPYRTPSPEQVARFVEIAEQGGLNVVIRHRKGDRINAACGQLRRGTAEG
ncbi:MAG: 23S rRNA (adenine(2503)-C(2))-methyltransferase RlmN [Planctomycetaceae bacterium]|nr:23S rRNA (adenine(2503)-C(2))-methyltransferase RlmN [Planctomycetaceae bacterium]